MTEESAAGEGSTGEVALGGGCIVESAAGGDSAEVGAGMASV